MLFRTKRFELEISGHLFLRAPLIGGVYVGPDAGYGCLTWNSPREIARLRAEFVERVISIKMG